LFRSLAFFSLSFVGTFPFFMRTRPNLAYIIVPATYVLAGLGRPFVFHFYIHRLCRRITLFYFTSARACRTSLGQEIGAERLIKRRVHRSISPFHRSILTPLSVFGDKGMERQWNDTKYANNQYRSIEMTSLHFIASVDKKLNASTNTITALQLYYRAMQAILLVPTILLPFYDLRLRTRHSETAPFH
jgi:hypothetical protein